RARARPPPRGGGYPRPSIPSAERDEPRFVEPRPSHSFYELWGRSSVDREGHDRFATLLRPRDGHVGGVAACLPEHRPDTSDDSGHVVVDEEGHLRRELDVDGVAERAREEEAVLGANGRPGDLDLLVLRSDDDANEVRVVLRGPGPRLPR